MFLCVIVVSLTAAAAATATWPCPCIISGHGVDTLGNVSVMAKCSNWDLTEVPACVPNDTTVLHMSGNKLSELHQDTVARMSALRDLFAERSHIVNLTALAFRGNPQLKELFLSNNGISNLPQGLFDTTPLLKMVDLSNNKLQSVPGGLFGRSPGLMTLDLSNNLLSVLPADLLGGCGALIALRLNHNQLTGLPGRLIANCTSLDTLEVAGNNITRLPVEVVEAAAKLSSLNRLWLYGNPWQCDCGLAPLAKLLQTHETFERDLTCRSPAAVRELHVFPVVSRLSCSKVSADQEQRSRDRHTPASAISASPVVVGVAACGSIALVAAAAFLTVRHRRKTSASGCSLLVNETV